MALFIQFYSLFINLPFNKTYISSNETNTLIKTGFYALTRHPGVLGFIGLNIAVTLICRAQLMLVAAPVFISLDITLVVIQDYYFFPKMFPGYAEYKKETPMLLPNRKSFRVFISNSKPVTKIKEVTKMNTAGELISQRKYEELWQKYCGFVDLKLADFMNIQKRLLMEQIELLNKCELGNHIMKGVKPQTVNEFREKVPITTYTDYAPFLLKRRKNCLPEKPLTWQHTSGRSGEFSKWVPITERCYQEIAAVCTALLIFGTCRGRGDIRIQKHDKLLYVLAPPPYLTGTWARCIEEEMPLQFLPPLDEAEKMSFEERTKKGIQEALIEGIDVIGGIPSILLAVGERFSKGGGSMKIMPLLRQPKMLARLLRGTIKSKIAGRPMLPKDLWSVKGIMAGGSDTSIYRDKIKEMWGKYPLDVYAFTEGATIATQTWDYTTMTFLPNFNFLEFIPEQESIKLNNDPSYKPVTLLLNEVTPNQNYELVITNFHGGAMIRYRVGDMIRIVSMRNDKLDIDIPQMLFYSRADNIIDIAGFTRLTEKTIWQALENSGVPYKDWTARREVKEQPILHIYLELKTTVPNEQDITEDIHRRLVELDADYANLESFLGFKPLEVTILSPGAFQSYTSKQQSAGVDLGKLKPPHVNPSELVLQHLINPEFAETVSQSQKSKREKVASV